MAVWLTEQLGSSGENIRTVQYLLQAHGATLPVDGELGARTQASVEGFQRARGLAVDGVVGSATWAALLVKIASCSSGPAVCAVQSQLAARIRSPAITGHFGTATSDLVRHFQRVLGLVADGVVGPVTWHALVTGGLAHRSGAEAAQAVFRAWTRNDPAAARRDAAPRALVGLFARSWSASDGWTFAGCEGAAGSVYCSWRGPGAELVLRSNNNVGAPFYFVEEATFTP
jgi:hypothetical protein